MQIHLGKKEAKEEFDSAKEKLDKMTPDEVVAEGDSDGEAEAKADDGDEPDAKKAGPAEPETKADGGEGTPVEPTKDLEEGLLKLINLRKSMMPRSPFIQSPRCYLAIDADVPWSRVVAVSQHAAAAPLQHDAV